MKRNQLLRIIAPLVAVCAFIGASAAGINKSFFNKAAREAWALGSDSLFNANATVPDSIADANSAVVIAAHDHFITNRVEQNSIYSATGRTNRTTLTHITKRMVKICDAAALEEFGSFDFGSKLGEVRYGLSLKKRAEMAFGAKIHKPSGQVIDVNVSEALEVSDGKKGKENRYYRLAIPGLEVGDVIEYFTYYFHENENGDIGPVDVNLAGSYPVLNGLITGEFHEDLTTEFRSYNGAPDIELTRGSKNTARLSFADIPAVSFHRFLNTERQMPFVRLNVVNNYVPKDQINTNARYSRRAGIYNNVSAAHIQRETMENIARIAHLLYTSPRSVSPIPGQAVKHVKKWRESHPEATPNQLADMAALSVRYTNVTAKEEDIISSPLLLALFHNQVIEKLNCYPRERSGIGFANTRDDVPTEEMAKWNQTEFMSIAGDTAYAMYPGLVYAPGELSALLQGECHGRILGQLRNLTYDDAPEYSNLPDSKYTGNRMNHTIDVSFDAEAPERMHISRSVELSGAEKELAEDFTDAREWLAEVENLLEIAPNKRYKPKNYDAVERQKELNTAARKECEYILGANPDTLHLFEITSRGIAPADPKLRYRIDCDVLDLTEDLGDGSMALNLGRLFGKTQALEGAERERLLDAMLSNAFTHRTVMTVHLPEGYKADASSLEAFGRQVANVVGAFTVIAKEKKPDELEIQCVNRVKYNTVPLSAWPMLRDLVDARTEFESASILIRPN